MDSEEQVLARANSCLGSCSASRALVSSSAGESHSSDFQGGSAGASGPEQGVVQFPPSFSQ